MFYRDNVRCFSNKDEHLYIFKMRKGNEVFFTTGIPAPNAVTAREIAKAEYKNAKIIALYK